MSQIFFCPKCNRWGMVYDGGAKILLCHYNNCNHVIRFDHDKMKMPSNELLEQVVEANKVNLGDN